MSDLEALWRAVLANPDEDTPRLMYADEVQESDPARAEFIRAHIARAKHIARGHGITYRECPVMKGNVSGHCAECEDAVALESRTHHVLLAAYRERWEPVCVACGGLKLISGGHFYTDGEFVEDDKITCTTCSGTGRQPCRWERGFPVVTVAEMRQAWEPTDVMLMSNPPQPVWKPTPWLCALLRTHHVAGVVPGDERLARGENVPPRVWELWELMSTGKLAMPALGRAVVLAALEWLDARGAA